MAKETTGPWRIQAAGKLVQASAKEHERKTKAYRTQQAIAEIEEHAITLGLTGSQQDLAHFCMR